MTVQAATAQLVDELFASSAERATFLSDPKGYLEQRGVTEAGVAAILEAARSKLIGEYKRLGESNPHSRARESDDYLSGHPSAGKVKDTSVAVGSAAVSALAAIVSSMTSLATASTSLNR